MTDPIIIVGAGQAGMKAAETLRREGYDGEIILAGAEGLRPYQRPPLSKAYLKGELAEERLFLKPEDYFEKEAISFLPALAVTAIDPADHRATFADGSVRAYHKLLLATGTEARRIALPGLELEGVFTLRGMADIAPIADALAKAENIVIIGGGFIGMEFAAVAAGFGKSVTVIESAPRILMRSVATAVSNALQELHRQNGVRLLLGQGVAAIEGHGRAEAVALAGGARLSADLVLLAVGANPLTDIAAAAGLAVDNGIVVDQACRTRAPDIFAAGDCTIFPSARYGRMIRLESVQNASDQARAAALSMLGQTVNYDPVPWFWSDQYKARLQIAGLSEGYDRTESEAGEDSLTLRYFRHDRLIAVDTINNPRAHMLARKTLAAEPVGRPKSDAA
ncbi:pyridine nucleotide-disulfide oxidoreductase [Martelella alba]|uniref:Pyridine nucleotide-disulfide oxidoreductase n=1 Tax=Martelella alba TaxID=2590451 RepID=A0A506U1J8_9HYPH|nr:FAD-dependent oxidoreductase [Martelella alba]TPW28242.1 pyridine nucleotide-disulfide oxidoreductase [Martelella alba]